MCWLDLELCTGDGCKTWPRKGLVHPTKSLPELLDLWSKDWSYLQILVYGFFSFKQFSTVNFSTWKSCLGNRTICMHWMDLKLCTGDGCKTWPRKGLVHPTKSLPELLDLWSKNWSYLQPLVYGFLFFKQFLTVNLSTWKSCLGNRTICMRWMDLKLCTGDGCKTWPRKGLVHPTKSLP